MTLNHNYGCFSGVGSGIAGNGGGMVSWGLDTDNLSTEYKLNKDYKTMITDTTPINYTTCYVQFLRSGSTRWVLIIGKLVFKIPSLHNYTNFLWGLLANMQEVKFSKCVDMKHKLCPIKFYLPLGFLVVMPKVRVLKNGELSKEELLEFCTEDNFKIPAETKSDSFGYYKEKLVAIDYG